MARCRGRTGDGGPDQHPSLLEVGDRAPDVTAPLAGGATYDDVDEFALADALDDGPVVLAFVPAAFTGWCASELWTFGNEYEAFGVVREGRYDVVTVAERSVFVVHPAGVVTCRWVEDADAEPDWAALVEDVAAAAAAAARA